MKTYLQVTLKDGTSCEDLRESALRDQSTYDGCSRWRWAVQWAFRDTAVPMDVNRVEKEKGKKGKSKGDPKGKDKVKVIRKVRLLERRVQTTARDMAISNPGVQDRLHGRAAHGMQLTTTMGRVANLAKVEKARMVARAKILHVT